MSLQRKIRNLIGSKNFKNYGIILLSVILILSVVPILFIQPANVFESIYYIRGYGGYGVPIIGLVVGIVLLYYGVDGLFKDRN